MKPGMKGLTAVTSVVADGAGTVAKATGIDKVASAVGDGVAAAGSVVGIGGANSNGGSQIGSKKSNGGSQKGGDNMELSVVIPGAVEGEEQFPESPTAMEQGIATQKTGEFAANDKVDKASLWSQTSEKKWNSREMAHYLDEKNAHPNNIVTKESLMEAFTGLEEDDADLILDESEKWVRGNKLRAELSMEDILRLIGRIDSNMREAKERYVFTNKQLGADDDRVLAERKKGANED